MSVCHVGREWLLLLTNSFSVSVILPFSLAKLHVSAEFQVCLVKEDEAPWTQGHVLLTLTTARSRPLRPLVSHVPVVSREAILGTRSSTELLLHNAPAGTNGNSFVWNSKARRESGEGASANGRITPAYQVSGLLFRHHRRLSHVCSDTAGRREC